jgi:DNA-directed RNA polymerase specialized sigma24 family protein
MDELWRIAGMTEQDRRISEIVAQERLRLRNFIRRRVPDPSDAEDIVQEVFYELVEAIRLLMPIEHVTGWLFRVARNRIIDLLRKKKPETFSDAAVEGADGEMLQIEDLLPSPDAGRRLSTSAACFWRSWSWRWTSCPRSSTRCLLHMNWKDAASRRWPLKPAWA